MGQRMQGTNGKVDTNVVLLALQSGGISLLNLQDRWRRLINLVDDRCCHVSGFRGHGCEMKLCLLGLGLECLLAEKSAVRRARIVTLEFQIHLP